MTVRNRRLYRVAALAALAIAPAAAQRRFVVTLPAGGHPVTGRLYVALSREEAPNPIQQAGSARSQAALFAVDVVGLEAGRSAVIDDGALGYPRAHMKDLPGGDYSARTSTPASRGRTDTPFGPTWISGRARNLTAPLGTSIAKLAEYIWMPRGMK